MQFYHWDSLPDGTKSKAGRKLTKFLRHLPSSSLVNLGQVIFLIDLLFLNHFNITLEEIFFIVKNDRKHRLALFTNNDNWWIAACQGHSNITQSIDTIEQHLLEPIVKIEITIPSTNVGDINSDLSGRRGRVLGMDSAGGGMQTITAEVPLAEVMTYARSLSSITGGQGSYALEYSHYDVVPGNVQQEIIAKAKLEEEEEE